MAGGTTAVAAEGSVSTRTRRRRASVAAAAEATEQRRRAGKRIGVGGIHEEDEGEDEEDEEVEDGDEGEQPESYMLKRLHSKRVGKRSRKSAGDENETAGEDEGMAGAPAGSKGKKRLSKSTAAEKQPAASPAGIIRFGLPRSYAAAVGHTGWVGGTFLTFRSAVGLLAAAAAIAGAVLLLSIPEVTDALGNLLSGAVSTAVAGMNGVGIACGAGGPGNYSFVAGVIDRKLAPVSKNIRGVASRVDALRDAVDKGNRGFSEADRALHAAISETKGDLDAVRVGMKDVRAGLDAAVTEKDMEGKMASAIADLKVALERGVTEIVAEAVGGAERAVDREGVMSIVRDAIHEYVDGGIEGPDYALMSAGGAVLSHSRLATNAPLPNDLWGRLKVATGIARVHPYASSWVLSPSSATAAEAAWPFAAQPSSPGDCLPLEGHGGTVLIRLRERVTVSSVALEHIPKKMAYDISTAPKAFSVCVYDMLAEAEAADREAEEGRGAEADGDSEPASAATMNPGRTCRHIGRFEYDVDGPRPSQTFAIHEVADATHVLFNVTSNHGNDDVTCVYRLKVFGTPS